MHLDFSTQVNNIITYEEIYFGSFLLSIFCLIVFCETIFEKVLCVVTDLKGIYKHYAPSFIVGANILKNNSWFFDLKNGLIKLELPQSTNKMSIKWKNHEDYHDVAKDYIVFDGSIKGQKTRFIFDTGCKFNKLQHGINLSNMVLIEKETANMDHKLSKETAYLFKNVDFKLGKNNLNVDFLKSEKKCCYLNIEFLNGRNFILNYPQKTLDIID